MDLENSYDEPTPQENKYFKSFSKALDEKNEKAIKRLIRKKGILQKVFIFSDEGTFLHLVAKKGTVDTAFELLQLGADVNIKGSFDQTPIYCAIKNSLEMVKFLIRNGADVNHTCSELDSPLHIAINHSTEVVDVLIKSGASVTSEDKVTLLHEALLNGSKETVRLVLRKALSEIETEKRKTRRNSMRETSKADEIIKIILKKKEALKIQENDYPLLILFAAKIGKEDVLKTTLDEIRKSSSEEASHSVDLNCKGFFQRTALHYAVRKQLPYVVKFLLAAGADANCKTEKGFTPLHYAAALENEEICRILLNFKAQVNPDSPGIGSPLYQVCGYSTAGRHLQYSDGYSYPEHEASSCASAVFNLKITQLLLQHGADTEHSGYEDTPLLEQCSSGNLEAVRILVEYGANMQVRTKQNNSVLHFAVLGKNIEVVELLLNKGLDIDVKNGNELTPLLFDMQKINPLDSKMIELLVKRGADVNCKSKIGRTPIYYAVKHSAELVKVFLESGASVSTLFKKDVTLLHEALLSGTPETVRIVLNKTISEIRKEKRITRNSTVKEVETSEETVKVILKNRALLSISTNDYPLLILFAAKVGSEEILKLVLNDVGLESRKRKSKMEVLGQSSSVNCKGYYKRTALHYAVREQLPEVVCFLLKAGADVNCKTKSGLTPLHYAVGLENEKICKMLLSFGASVNPDSPKLANLLLQVCGFCSVKEYLVLDDGYFYEEFRESETGIEQHNPKIAKLLLENGADPNAQVCGPLTPFFEACLSGPRESSNDIPFFCFSNLQSMKVLLEFGANIRVRDSKGNTALHYAVKGESLLRFAIVTFLLEKGLDVNVRNFEGYTPLLLITQRYDPLRLDMIRFLVNRGADVNRISIKGETAMHYAVRESAELVKILLENGADVRHVFKTGVTLLHEALLSGTEETVRLLLTRIMSEIAKEKAKKRKSSGKEPETATKKAKKADGAAKSANENTNSGEADNTVRDGEKTENQTEEVTTEELVKTLLKNKKILNIKRKDYPLLVLFGAKLGKEDIFQLILKDVGENLILGQSDNDSDSSEPGDTEGYVPHFPEELNCLGYYERTALHYAIREQLPEVVDFLLKAGADVNCRTRAGFTPLHYAACLQNEKICKILLSSGAEVNPHSPKIGSPLFQVCGESTARHNLICNGGYYYREIDQLDFSNIVFDRELTMLLLESGADPNLSGNGGTTPFLEICQGGSLEPLKILERFGANFGVRDDRGFSALHYAAVGNCLELMDFLLKKGMDINVKNNFDHTPLLQVMQEEKLVPVDMIEYLVDNGADVNAKDGEGMTALHIAASYFESKEFVECLLELGADFKLKHGFTPRWLLRSYPFYYGRKTLISFIALTEHELGDYINCYFDNEAEELTRAFEHFRVSRLELESLKARKIVPESRVSFYDFLTRPFYNAVQFLKNGNIKKVFQSRDYYKEFPCYSYLLEKRFERIIILWEAVNRTENFLFHYLSLVPILAIRKILYMMSSSDFRKFDAVLSKSQNFVEKELDPNLQYFKVYEKAKIVEIRENGVMVVLYPNMTPALLLNSQLNTSCVSHPGALKLKVQDEIPVQCMGRYPWSGELRLSGRI